MCHLYLAEGCHLYIALTTAMRGYRSDGQSVGDQVATLRKHGAGKVFREVASGAKTNRVQLRRVIDQLQPGDVLMVTRLDRLA
jgi:DNA invertase Pin-like site-specific DNA recombinase